MNNPEHRVFAACPRYVQGPGAIERLAKECEALGERPVVIIDAFVAEAMGSRLLASFRSKAPPSLRFAGEITLDSIEALRAVAAGYDPDVIVAIGGGKALDAGKAVARRLKITVVSVPTLASQDGPASRGIAIYDDQHRLTVVEQLSTNPAVVLVDTAIIAAAPVDFIRAGIGDAIAKKFEAEASAAASGLNKHGTHPLHAALFSADCAYRLLRRHGAAAVHSVERGRTSDDLEATVEAVILLSAVGFENSGLSIAHSLTRGLVLARGAKDAPHGYHVAYGLLVQFAVEDRGDSEILDLGAFYREVGLPIRLADMGMAKPGADEIQAICERTMASPHIGNLRQKTSLEGLATALVRVERLADDLLET